MTDLNEARTYALNALRYLRLALPHASPTMQQSLLGTAIEQTRAALRLMRVDPETGQVMGDPTPACVDPAEL